MGVGSVYGTTNVDPLQERYWARHCASRVCPGHAVINACCQFIHNSVLAVLLLSLHRRPPIHGCQHMP